MSFEQKEKSIVKGAINDAIIKEIVEAVNGLKYGYVHIVVHNSKIVQIDKTQKLRFDNIWPVEKGGGI